MIVDVAIPIHGLTITEARIVRWLKQPGDRVEAGEAVLEVETDKSVDAVESPASGWILDQLAREGDVVPLGKVVARLGTDPADKAPPFAAPALSSVELKNGPPGSVQASTRSAAATPRPPTAAKASPRARRTASRLHVDLAAVAGTGRGGLHIRERDVLRAAEFAGPGHRLRQVIARRTAESFREAPHFYLTREVSAERLVRYREAALAEPDGESPRITLTDCFIRALAGALEGHPALNARWSEQGPVQEKSVDIGLAVEIDGGLVAPLIRGAEALPLAGIAAARSRIVERAKRGELSSRDLDGGGFTLSNLGVLGVDQFQAIINPPQCGILAVGAIRPRPFAVDGQLALARTVFLTLSIDHRIADGAAAARLLGRIAELVDDPEQRG